MAEILPVTRFGNPILREKARRLDKEEILSDTIQTLVKNMRYTLVKEKAGVGLAAPQVGESIALSVIGIKPTPNHPELKPFNNIIINPKIIETYGGITDAWEGCISCGSGADVLYARLPRFEKIRVRWVDEHAKRHEELIGGFVAQVVQHETDHLNGILFVDHVVDTTSYMMADEYRKRIVGK